MNKTIYALVTAIILGGLVLLTARRADEWRLSNKIQNSKTIKIGALLCLTGVCAETGQESLKGIRLAIAQLNSKGGILGKQIELLVEDSREGNPAAAVSGFQRLRADRDIRYVIGPTWTPAGLALAPIVSREKDLIMTSPSLGVKDFNETGKNLFNTWPHDEISSRKLARYAWDQGWKKAAVFSSQQPWTQAQSAAFIDEFKHCGGSIVAQEEPLETSRDLKIEAQRIADAHPDVVLFSSQSEQTGIAVRELASKGYRGPRMMVLLDETRLKDGGEFLEGVIFPQHDSVKSGFIEAFTKAYGTRPGISADTAYDAMMAYAENANLLGSTETSSLAAAMRSSKIEGATGALQFDSNGGVLREPTLYHVENGAFIELAKNLPKN